MFYSHLVTKRHFAPLLSAAIWKSSNINSLVETLSPFYFAWACLITVGRSQRYYSLGGVCFFALLVSAVSAWSTIKSRCYINVKVLFAYFTCFFQVTSSRDQRFTQDWFRHDVYPLIRKLYSQRIRRIYPWRKLSRTRLVLFVDSEKLTLSINAKSVENGLNGLY